jgi:hypothetical protein
MEHLEFGLAILATWNLDAHDPRAVDEHVVEVLSLLRDVIHHVEVGRDGL